MQQLVHGKFLFLGTGSSTGIPVITCKCVVCHSTHKKNKRLRPAGLIRVKGKHFLIDAGPDFRTQALQHHIYHLDGVLLTHGHFDHIAGLDDLRVFYFLQKKRLPCLLSKELLEELRVRYDYFFRYEEEEMMGGSRFSFHALPDDFGSIDFQGIHIGYCSFLQKGTKVTGFRIGNFAYILDIREFSEEIFDFLKGVEVLILSALRYTPSPAHFSLEEAIAFATKVGAKKIFFSHIAHEIDHSECSKKLPPHIALGYDGLEMDF